MCLAHILRFRCGHGLLMSIESCRLGPCPVLKTTGAKLPQQPSKCYNCEYRRASTNRRSTAIDSSCDSSIGSLTSESSTSSALTLTRAVTAPLPNVARQPTGTLQYCHPSVPGHKRSTSNRSFSFSCSSGCSHNTLPHYNNLPGHLPHQSHPCPPCQISQLRMDGDSDAAACARREFPHLTADMLIKDGKPEHVPENWKSTLTLEKYVAEKRAEEKQIWWGVVRKWGQDLKNCRVLIGEEDGLGLLQ